MKLLICFLVGLVLTVLSDDDSGWAFVGNPLFFAHPCQNSTDITLRYEPGRAPEEENSYIVIIDKYFPQHSLIVLKFDAEARVTLTPESSASARISGGDHNSFRVNFFKQNKGLTFEVQGIRFGIVPYFQSVIINNKEYCKEPNIGILDSQIRGYSKQAESARKPPQGNCGRPKVLHTELIVKGASTKAGDWPWHVALYRVNRSEIKYICGGTLISNYYILTAAHCASIRGVPIVPEALSVILGKYNLIGGDPGTQERRVFKVILHEGFNHKDLKNDIALLKVNSEIKFTDYVQPACLWYPQASEKLLRRSEILGTIVGWGFDITDSLTPHLRQAQLPMVSENVCLKSYPTFYGKVLDENKFCAGFRDGVSACNGDSGSAFQIFLPDDENDDDGKQSGAWYVRGIVSLTVSRKDAPVCDPSYYGVYTDVSKYVNWIEENIKT